MKLSKQPSRSIPQGCDEWADTKATYELFKNEKVTAEKLRQPHQARTWARVAEYECVLAVQDTSYLDYSHYEKMAGLGPIGTQAQKMRGVVMHGTMAVTPRYRQVKLKAPYRPQRSDREPLPTLTVYAILVREDNPPEGMTPVEWLLLTNVPLNRLEDTLERIEWYCQRWQIEIFHKILKSGCRIEHRRLKNFDRLQPCIALFSIIAWRIHYF